MNKDIKEALALRKQRIENMKAQMGKLLHEIRLRNKLTQQFVSDHSGFSEKGISNIEKNRESYADSMMRLFCYYYENEYTTEEDQEKWRRIGMMLISLEEYDSIKETEYIMKSPTMMDIIRKGDEELKNGGGRSN